MTDNCTYHSAIKTALHLMQQWPLFMDGIDRIIGFWASSDNYQGVEWKRSQEEVILEITPEIQNHLIDTNNKTQAFQWYRADHLPFTTQDEPTLGQLDLFSGESNYLVLLIKQKVNNSEKLAQYFLFFREDKSNFGMTGNKEAYTTSEKVIIGRMASRFANLTVENYIKQIDETFLFKSTTRKLLEAKQEELIDIQNTLTEWKNNWIDSFIEEQSQRNGFNYVINNEVRTKLFKACHSLKQIEDSIKKSLVYICNLYPSEPGDTIELDLPYLQISTLEAESTKTTIPIISRYSKTMNFLDRLEKSAQKVIDQGYNLTSAEVGKNMDKAITAPAISDALKKNKVRILQLIDQYPQRWGVIRKQFKPLVNLQDKNNRSLSLTS